MDPRVEIFLSPLTNHDGFYLSHTSLIGHSKMELTDVDFSFQKFHWLYENNETDQGDFFDSFWSFLKK